MSKTIMSKAMDSARSQLMNRRELVLAALAAADGESHTPVQVQKLFFLIDENIQHLVGGRKFQFTPYHYGPFDQAVYRTLDELTREGRVERLADSSWTSYRLTPQGQKEGDELLNGMAPAAAAYVRKASAFVRRLSFAALVSAIYKAYPEMSRNSVFRNAS